MIPPTPTKKGRSDLSARPSSNVTMTAASRLIQQDCAKTINNQFDGINVTDNDGNNDTHHIALYRVPGKGASVCLQTKDATMGTRTCTRPISRAVPGESRAADVKRTAVQLQARAKFLNGNAGEGAPYRPRLLAAAAVSELSDGAFRVLAIRSIYANPDGTSCTVSQKTIAHLLCKSLSTIERADNELKGWAGKKARGNEKDLSASSNGSRKLILNLSPRWSQLFAKPI